ncbi:MAG: thiamine phosphate synthase [Acidobacteriota bacterium]|nr:thiamine phosphate synthase [Acidobacteriota bacterium]
MSLDLQRPQKPLIYLITSGETTSQTTTTSKDFANVLKLVKAAVAAEIDLVQIREKQLDAGVLYQLTESAAAITNGSATRLLVNDRADIASAAGADGVHLTSNSMPTDVVRNTFGREFLIGVSTHSLAEATNAHENGADFIVFGPVFETSSKQQYGEPVGLIELAKVTSTLKPFPVMALGGITLERVSECFRSGAQGIAAIGMLNDPSRLSDIANDIRARFDPH